MKRVTATEFLRFIAFNPAITTSSKLTGDGEEVLEVVYETGEGRAYKVLDIDSDDYEWNYFIPESWED